MSSKDNFHDLVGVGSLILTERVNNLPDNLKNLDAYIFTHIRKEMLKYITFDSLIKMSDYAKKVSIPIKVEYWVNEEDIGIIHGDQGLLEIRELLEGIPKTENENVIFNCIMEGGYQLQDMADMCINIGKTRVCQIKQELELKMLEAFRKD
jgi:DNA-directed RNA polymerase specialized sigma subunit